MQVGKLNNTILKRTILKTICNNRINSEEGPGVGQDAGFILKSDTCSYAISTNPFIMNWDITSISKRGLDSMQMASIAVTQAFNNLYCVGAKPIAITLSIFINDRFSEEKLKNLMKAFKLLSYERNFKIINGHTEVTNAVNSLIVSVTGIGEAAKASNGNMSNIKPGQAIVMTKRIALLATSIIANTKENNLMKRFSPAYIDGAKKYLDEISIEKEAAVAVKHGVTAMHDISKYGIYNALWELAEASKLGFRVDIKKISVNQETIEFCEMFDLNPYEQDSTGALLMVTSEADELVSELQAEGIEASIIGIMEKGNNKLIVNNEEVKYLDTNYKGPQYI